MAAEKREKKILAVDIKSPTVVASPLGGSVDAKEGDVFLVGTEVDEGDAGFLVAAGIAEACAPALKAEREKARAKAEK